MPIPDRLYRYTAIRDYTDRVFLHRELHFAGPAAFNDPFDCRVSYSTESSETAFAELAKAPDSWLGRVISARYPSLPFEIAVSRAFRERDSLVNEQSKAALDAYVASTGICCFAESNDNLLMWSHYADKHTGICLEFSTANSQLFLAARPVVYTNDCPAFECFNHDHADIAQRALFRKAPGWEYEKEWRLLCRKAGETRVFEPETLSAVFIGARISEAHAAKVKSWCTMLQPKPDLFRATLTPGVYGLTFTSEPLRR